MITLGFLVEWALRSSALISGGGLLLYFLRVKNPSVRLAAWTAVLCGSLAIPLIGPVLPRLPFTVPEEIPVAKLHPAAVSVPLAPSQIGISAGSAAEGHFDWVQAAELLYLLAAGLLLLRLATGIVLARRVLRGSTSTGLSMEGVRILESGRIASPVTFGLLSSTVVLPRDWAEWGSEKLAAVLAHERSHVLRRDPAVQLLSALHRSLLWYSPLSWYLHRSIVHLAEEASDDAAIAATGDPASYAELLLDFMQRGVRRPGLQAVAMARYGKPEKRIDRILEGESMPNGLTRKGLAAIALIGLPVVFVAAAAGPRPADHSRAAQDAAEQPREVAAAASTALAPVSPAAASASSRLLDQGDASAQSPRIRHYIIRMGDNMSGSWDSRDTDDQDALRRRYGDRYAWFMRDGKGYVITDTGVLAELEKAMEPQKRVNKLQSDVNALQAKVNERQSGVNSPQQTVNTLQQQVNALQQEVNRRQDLVNQVQRAVQEGAKEELIRRLEEALRELRAGKVDASQEEVNRRQAEVNKAQEEVNKAQERVNAEQEKVNQQQQRVNEEQRRVSAEFDRRVQEIFDTAVRRGLALPSN